MQKLHVLIAERWRWLQQHIVESRYNLRATTVRGVADGSPDLYLFSYETCFASRDIRTKEITCCQLPLHRSPLSTLSFSVSSSLVYS